jgi:hypothetical protein
VRLKCLQSLQPLYSSEELKVSDAITINVPVVSLARDVMILIRKNPFQGPLEVVVTNLFKFQNKMYTTGGC